jgi:hypothetical protein
VVIVKMLFSETRSCLHVPTVHRNMLLLSSVYLNIPNCVTFRRQKYLISIVAQFVLVAVKLRCRFASLRRDLCYTDYDVVWVSSVRPMKCREDVSV